mmetsp:Transcript_2977/g.5036  ORF Transcript_2977/g.5036 Transcript_2977/m.5036 type:complete len:211 (-) Transcript_2977:123-755(-)|eukprot:CAMPEP_0168623032 /NCGR_PEP_ID=MMETSP0449_2-20121227/8601_1 /TAXON_ID=1082188 /ORGANISM="Strombidium rassoulzadegani, Strain ras09" /LENGTH=210 /DNA_ID=CAMNT_0008664371 /DNA_START=207 /DNA_END=839 /DNA_ORIENTATION=-
MVVEESLPRSGVMVSGLLEMRESCPGLLRSFLMERAYFRVSREDLVLYAAREPDADENEEEGEADEDDGPRLDEESEQIALAVRLLPVLREEHAEHGACDDEEDGEHIVLGEALLQDQNGEDRAENDGDSRARRHEQEVPEADGHHVAEGSEDQADEADDPGGLQVLVRNIARPKPLRLLQRVLHEHQREGVEEGAAQREDYRDEGVDVL